MSDINRITLTGRVGKDPEFKTPGSATLATFSLAVNQWMGEEKGEEAMWITVNIWGNRSKVAEYIEKGMKLTIEGKLRVTSKERDDGDGWITYVNIDADNVVLPDRGDGGGKSSKSSRGSDDSKSSGSGKSSGRGSGGKKGRKSRSRDTAF